MGTCCTLGVERTKRDNDRVETINNQSERLNYLSEENKCLKAKIRKLEKKTILLKN